MQGWNVILTMTNSEVGESWNQEGNGVFDSFFILWLIELLFF